ncbi:MAG: dual specificity protein phosphatase family protein [Candidatus Competibacteraceae bacterium]|nr:dual specificity protein phosphatase family protein [Candidatus Competibacteraceae bacterium]MCP5132425.1 dual specificity protein phosphatase family protein [Gammaproteobacteria bacterium]
MAKAMDIQTSTSIWRWQLNWSVIRHDLVIGSCPRSLSSLDQIRAESKVSAILSVQHDECLEKLEIDYPRLVRHGQTLGLSMQRSPMRDFDIEDQRHQLPNAVRALHYLLSQGHCVYLHCTAGINRSPLTALAYLTWVEGQRLDEALVLLRQARPEVYPYLDAYEGCFQDLSAAHARQIQARTEELNRQYPRQIAQACRLQAAQEIIRDVLII